MRRALPKAELERRGSRRARAMLPELEVAPGQSLPERPADLPPVAASEWDRIVAILWPLGAITALDLTALRHLCILHDNLAWLDAMVEQEVDPGKRSTLIGRRNRAFRVWLDAAGKFGMTPADRARVKLPNSESRPKATDRFFPPKLFTHDEGA